MSVFETLQKKPNADSNNHNKGKSDSHSVESTQHSSGLKPKEEAGTEFESGAMPAIPEYRMMLANPGQTSKAVENSTMGAESPMQGTGERKASGLQPEIAEDSQRAEAPAEIATAQGGLVFLGPVGVGLAIGITAGGVSIWWYYEGGGREFLGEVTGVIQKGIRGTVDEIGQILQNAGRGSAESLEAIEDYIRSGIFRSDSDSEDRESEPSVDYDVDDIIDSSRRPSRGGSEATRGQQSIQKRIDNEDAAYEGLGLFRNCREAPLHLVV